MADKKISQLTAAGPLTGAELVPIVQNGSTVKASAQDIANTAVSLSFSWNTPDRISSTWIDGTYKPLKITFNNLVLQPGVTYTLLIDRWRKSELKSSHTVPSTYRKSKFYHELAPEDNDRQNEIVITSTTQVFDFNQDHYFHGEGSFPLAKGGTGAKYGDSATVKLGFRIRISGPSGTYETPTLGSLLMIGRIDPNTFTRTISYGYNTK